ncbi:MAG TPA: helix-turn-helix domain-containing protein [Steroidobacteraceae bacterium]|jgi:transcriptional regulator with XRE-family HTH domain
MIKPSSGLTGEQANGLIARQIGRLRKSQNLSFDALAARSEVSKGMLVAIEQGGANPSIATLCKLASSLRVSVTDLLGENIEPSCAVQVVAPDQARELWQGPKGGRAVLLVGSHGPDMLELWEWTLLPGEEFYSKGHPVGTMELLAVSEGILCMEVEGTINLIAAEHRAVAMTDRPHTYRCHGKKRARFQMAIHEPAQHPTKRSASK